MNKAKAGFTGSCNGKGQAFRRGLALGFGAVLLWLISGTTNVAAMDGYKLGPQDRVRVKVFEWRASRDEVYEWKALNDEFVVGANGMLSLPLAGEIPAAGIETSELARTIAERLRVGMGLGRVPDASVEIVQFRPFYIIGHVDKPGEFPYRPGLTVLKALSIAGGLRRLGDQSLNRLERDAIASRGDLRVLTMHAHSLRVRRARLQAELNGAETMEPPRELAGRQNEPAVALLLQQERQIFDARREAFQTQMRALEQLKGYLEKEVVSLNAQIATEETQLKLVKKELDSVSALVDKGLAVAPRQLSLERTAAQIEGDRLRVGASLLRARQEISKTEIAILELRNKRANEVAVELRETQTKLDEIDRKADTAVQLIYEAEVIAPLSIAEQSRARRSRPIFSIARWTGGKLVEIAADETTPVQPGDTIKVELPLGLDDLPLATPSLPAGGRPAARTETQ